MNYKVFISHSSIDTWVATQISKNIETLKVDTFLDESRIAVGDDFEDVILTELRSSKELLVLFTPWTLKSTYVWLEIGAAWGIGIRIVGILYGVTVKDLNETSTVPILIKKTNLLEINNLDKYFEQLKKRIK